MFLGGSEKSVLSLLLLLLSVLNKVTRVSYLAHYRSPSTNRKCMYKQKGIGHSLGRNDDRMLQCFRSLVMRVYAITLFIVVKIIGHNIIY